MIIVKVRDSNGNEVHVSVAEDGDGLFSIVADFMKIEIGSFELLRGFPPKAIEDNEKGTKTARELGVRNNEGLILRKKEEATGIERAQRLREQHWISIAIFWKHCSS